MRIRSLSLSPSLYIYRNICRALVLSLTLFICLSLSKWYLYTNKDPGLCIYKGPRRERSIRAPLDVFVRRVTPSWALPLYPACALCDVCVCGCMCECVRVCACLRVRERQSRGGREQDRHKERKSDTIIITAVYHWVACNFFSSWKKLLAQIWRSANSFKLKCGMPSTHPPTHESIHTRARTHKRAFDTKHIHKTRGKRMARAS